MRPEQRLARIREIIEGADTRAAAVDGPVDRIQHHITDKEFREIYLLTNVHKPKKPRRGNPTPTQRRA